MGQESQAFLDYLPVLSHVFLKVRSCSPTRLHLEATASGLVALYFLILVVAPADNSSPHYAYFLSPPAFRPHVPLPVYLQCTILQVLTLVIPC